VKRSAAESVAFTARTTAAARQNLTPAHRALWNALRLTPGSHSEYNVIGTTKNGGRFPYRLDLYHPASRLAVEVDGGIHARTRGRDRRRDTRMALQGVRTLRYSNARVLTDLDGVIAEIEEEIRESQDAH
jgi:very-short-patch-repair endonuclease